MADSQKGMHKADFLTSLFLLAFGIMVVVLSIRMPRLEHRGINPYTIPGLVPGLLGAAVIIMSLMLLGRSIVHHGYSLALSGGRVRELLAKPQVIRVSLTLAVCLAYALGLVGTIWYPVSTFLFVFAFIVIYEYRRDQTFRGQSRHVVTAGIEALLTAAVVSAVFRYLFLVRLP